METFFVWQAEQRVGSLIPSDIPVLGSRRVYTFFSLFLFFIFNGRSIFRLRLATER